MTEFAFLTPVSGSLASAVRAFVATDSTYAGGAKGDGVTDDTAALVAAWSAAQLGKGIVFVPPGVYRYSAKIFDITGRGGIVGAGARQTFFQPLPSFHDYAVTITDIWRNGNPTANSTTFDIANSKPGVLLQGFTIVGDRTVGGNKGIATRGIVDFLTMRDVGFICLDGTALQLGVQDWTPNGSLGCLRESYFENIFIELSGNLTEPALDIGNGTTGSGDGTNDLTFRHVVFANNKGVHWRIRETHAGSTMRGIFGYGLILNGDGPEAASPTPADIMQIEGLVSGVELHGYLLSGSAVVSGTPYAGIRIKDNATGTPDAITLDGHITSILGDGYVIDKCNRIAIKGNSGVTTPGLTELKIAAGQPGTFELTYDVTSRQSILGRQAFISIGDEDAASKITGAIHKNAAVAAPDLDTTPDVRNVSVLLLNNTAPTSVTDFDNGGKSQELTVFASSTDAGTTLVHSASMILRGARNRLLQQNECVKFFHNGSTIWHEIGLTPLQVLDGWIQDNVAASQTNVELTRALGRWRAVRAGSVTGIVVTTTEARTAGTLTIKVFKNTGLAGAAGGQLGTLTAVLDGTNTIEAASYQRAGIGTFEMGDELYITVTTDGSWTPTTADIRCALEVVT